jgi:hypothetical protein
MVISDVIKYKNKIMNKLLSINDVFTLINNTSLTDAAQMKNVNIFPFMKVPDITTTVKNYICFDFNGKTSTKNNLYNNIFINIAVVCHEAEIKTSWGSRHDVLGGVIIDNFNWSNFLGLELELISDNESILSNSYHVRTLQFKNLTLNGLENGVKINGTR